MAMESERVACLKINCPDVFADPEFRDWLDDPANGVATWHPPGTEPGECSDVFVTFDHGEGSDAFHMPGHCWLALCREAEARGFSYGVLWLTNLDGDLYGGGGG
jgi:hypothetical protein